MAFKKIINYNPDIPRVDSRVEDQWILNSSHITLSISKYRTLEETNKKGGIESTKIVGLISSVSNTENMNLDQFFEIGTRKILTVPGKTRGVMSLSSEVVESVNLLGSISESILESLKEKYGNIYTFKNGDKNIINPTLSKYYAESEFVINEDPSKASPGIPSDMSGYDTNTNKGAISLSINDIKFKFKFGLSLLLWQ